MRTFARLILFGIAQYRADNTYGDNSSNSVMVEGMSLAGSTSLLRIIPDTSHPLAMLKPEENSNEGLFALNLAKLGEYGQMLRSSSEKT
jgi:hypothetical protein